MALAARRLARRRSFAQHRDISTLILLRHGTSEWNGAEARFSGWCDIPLTLQRAHETCELALASMAGHCQHTWSTDRIQRDRRLNERHYGALQGHFKDDPDLVAGFGIPKLREWKRSMHGTPPALDERHAHYQPPPAPLTESLADVRVEISSSVTSNNTLRALMAAIDEVPDDDVPALHVPNSVPILYRFDVDRRARLREALQGSGTQSHARWMLTPENHAQVHDALESGGLLTRAFFESVDVKRNGAVSVRELDLSLTAYLKEAELGNNRIDCAVTAVAKKINQQAGAIRKGHIKEFLVPSSAKLAAADESGPSTSSPRKCCSAPTASTAPAPTCPRTCPDCPRRAPLWSDGDFHVHAHEHPAVVQRVAVRGGVPPGAIALSEVQRLNNRVCVHDDPTWTLYRGKHETLDAREAAMGATAVARAVPDLDAAAIIFEVRLRFDRPGGAAADHGVLRRALTAHCFGCLVTAPELFVLPGVEADDGSSVELVARVVEVRCERDDDDDGDDDGDGRRRRDDYRGRFATATAVYAVADGNAPASTRVEILRPAAVPPARNPTDYVDVVCAEDDEVFPVRRALLRPCLALTRAAQAGRGKYDAVQDSVSVPLDCCTFDRVLLYLQHERRREPFAFDPTLAPELLRAAEALKIRGLEDAGEQGPGLLRRRVRKAPIRLAEVDARNAKGGETDPRGETWLVLDGMVLDITRWLGEHPGGNTIIPSRRSAATAPSCSRSTTCPVSPSRTSASSTSASSTATTPRRRPATPAGAATAASPAFLAELRRHTAWRLKDADPVYPTWKSF
ncbi:hypothetical protein JL722_13109 [Aureococcus anophagefferens]|nr:hypothetical protein JL722_13109 [Aureococcus anophagefferens]